jgi:hypothetical protein
MIDKTTVGVTAEPEEVEAVLHNLCGYHLAERDPLFRYTVLTREQVLYDALVAAIKRERGRALSELVASGTTMTHAAQMTNLTSRQQVQRLIAIARAAEEAAAEVQAAANDPHAAANDFEERMAAVEATLDEVVSGIMPPAPEPQAEAEPEPQPQVERELVPAADLYADTSTGIPVVPGVVPVGALLGEATQLLPALTPVIHPTREVQSDDARWWRRGRDTGAA